MTKLRSCKQRSRNADGSIIVGWQDQPTGERSAAKWVNTVPELILTPNGRLNGEAQAVSADGQTIVGGGYKFGHAAWIWRAETGVRPIGVHGAGTFTALDVSDNGHVVVGFIARERQGRVDERGFIWREGKDPAQIDEFLKKHGAVVPAGWILSVASLISADGKTIYGWGFNPDGLVEMFKIELE